VPELLDVLDVLDVLDFFEVPASTPSKLSRADNIAKEMTNKRSRHMFDIF